jgi:TetR/AcrR family transcriptional repressor of nem operon
MGRCSDAKERLVATAARLFRERGYTAVSVADICDAAALKKGSFYHFYASKLDLALEAIDEYAKGYAELAKVGMRDGLTAPAKLEAMFAALRSSVTQRCAQDGCARGCPIGNLALEMADREEAIRRKIASIFDQLRAAIESIITRGIAAGELQPVDAGRSAESIVAMIQGAMVLTKTANDPQVMDRLLGGTMQSLLRTAPPPAA